MKTFLEDFDQKDEGESGGCRVRSVPSVLIESLFRLIKT